MDLTQVKELIELVKEAGINELDVAEGAGGDQKRIRIVVAAPAPAGPSVAAPQAAPSVAKPDEPAPPASGNVVSSPLAGTFYRAPAPGEKPFVGVGDSVAVGDVLCIIESMKMMNRVRSDQAGEVVAILVEDGQPVGTGAGLFRLA